MNTRHFFILVIGNFMNDKKVTFLMSIETRERYLRIILFSLSSNDNCIFCF